jgi:hypothetical protein
MSQDFMPIGSRGEIALSVPIDDLNTGGIVVQWNRHRIEHDRLHATTRELIPKRLE